MQRWIRAVVVLAIAIALGGTVRAQQAYDTHSRHYQISTDVDRDTMREIARHMDAVHQAYSKTFSSFRARTTVPVRLYIARTQEGYHTMLESKGIDGSNSGGMFFANNEEAGVATWYEGRPRERMDHVLQHEGFHQFAHVHIGGNFPIWANEGLAEYFGSAILIGERLETGLVPSSRLERIKQAIRDEATLPFDDFIRLDDRSWSRRVAGGDARTGTMYDQAWSVAHFLIHGDNGRYSDAFEHFIRETSRGLAIDNALQNAFGTTDLEAFQDAWERWTLELEPDAISTANERLVFLAEGLKLLHAEGVAVTTLEELRDALRARLFRLQRVDHGQRVVFDAADDALFEAPPSVSRRIEAVIALGETGADGTPPTLEVTGQRVRMGVSWSLDEDAEPAYELVYR